MINIVLLLFLIGHFLADFYFKTYKQINGTRLFNKLIKANIVYFITMLLIIIPVFNFSFIKWVIIIAFIHLVSDYVCLNIEKNRELNKKLGVKLFLFAQFIQIITIIIVTMIMFTSSSNINYVTWFELIIKTLSIDIQFILSWILAILIIIKPISITIKKLLYYYRPMLDEEEKGHPNAGALIGILERCIILIFLFMGQYTAIGFVLTAKSIARYNKIVEDPKFSEYYLLGTLLSTLLVIVVYLLVFSLI